MFEGVRAKLGELQARDPGYRVFGATTHRHRLAPPATADEVARVEERLASELPDEYRVFITEFGNGGMGPGYGLDRVLALDEAVDRSHLGSEGSRLVVGKPGTRLYAPRLVGANGCDIDPFDVALFGLANRLVDVAFVELLRRPFPLEPVYGTPTAGRFERTPGLLPINDYGCGIFAGVVLNGAHRGQIWVGDPNVGATVPFGVFTSLHGRSAVLDARPFSFATWYQHWLDLALADPELPSTAVSA